MATAAPALDYVRGRVPLYTLREVAAFVDVPESTLGTWANGYERRPAGRPAVKAGPVITRLPGYGGAPSVPFVGLAEAMALAALRRDERIPLPKIRRVIEHLQRELGLEHALASRNLYRVGATFVYDYATTLGDSDLMDLVEIQGKQAVWVDSVRLYLANVAWDEGGWPKRIRLPRYPTADVVVDPYHGSGAPYFAGSGVPVSGVIGRFRGGDSPRLLARDYGLNLARIREVLADPLDSAA
jgi:uncharacterized protein (DUF433 family)